MNSVTFEFPSRWRTLGSLCPRPLRRAAGAHTTAITVYASIDEAVTGLTPPDPPPRHVRVFQAMCLCHFNSEGEAPITSRNSARTRAEPTPHHKRCVGAGGGDGPDARQGRRACPLSVQKRPVTSPLVTNGSGPDRVRLAWPARGTSSGRI
jgi:hypothetical protein